MWRQAAVTPNDNIVKQDKGCTRCRKDTKYHIKNQGGHASE